MERYMDSLKAAWLEFQVSKVDESSITSTLHHLLEKRIDLQEMETETRNQMGYICNHISNGKFNVFLETEEEANIYLDARKDVEIENPLIALGITKEVEVAIINLLKESNISPEPEIYRSRPFPIKTLKDAWLECQKCQVGQLELTNQINILLDEQKIINEALQSKKMILFDIVRSSTKNFWVVTEDDARVYLEVRGFWEVGSFFPDPMIAAGIPIQVEKDIRRMLKEEGVSPNYEKNVVDLSQPLRRNFGNEVDSGSWLNRKDLFDNDDQI